MTTKTTHWRKSSYSGAGGGQNDCVEVAATLAQLRDSKNTNGTALRGDVAALVAAVKDGRIG